MEDKLLITWEEFTEDCKVLAAKINEKGQPFPSMLVVARGGLVVAGILAPLLDIRDIHCVGLESYSENGKRGNIIQHNDLDVGALDENFLVVDDLVDSGHTINYINNLGLPNSAVLYRKTGTEFEPTFFVREVPAEKWIVFPWE